MSSSSLPTPCLLLRLVRLLAVGALVVAAARPQHHASAQEAPIPLTIGTASGRVGDTVDVPVTVGDVTGRGVLAFEIEIDYDENRLAVASVETAGAVAGQFGFVSSNAEGGVLRIAGAGATPLTGSGTFLTLRLALTNPGTASLRFTGTNVFNEGSPALTLTDGSVSIAALPTISVSPSTTTLLRGETASFTASGGTAPYTWSVTDDAVASIDASTGQLTALAPGTTQVVATDADGVASTSGGAVEVRGFALAFPGDVEAFEGEVVDVPVTTTSLDGLGVTAGSFRLNFNPDVMAVEAVETAGTLLAGAEEVVFNPDGSGAAFAFASTSAVTGAGTLLTLRVRLGPERSGTTSVSFDDVVFNEDLVGSSTSGSVRALALPTLTVSPGSGSLLVGQTLALSAGGDVTPPVTWSVDDASVASIDPATGVLTAVRGGTVTATATDALGATGTGGPYTVFDFEVTPGEVTTPPGTTARLPVAISDVPDADGILAFETTVTFDPAVLSLEAVVTDGTLAAGWTVAVNPTAPGEAVVAAAGPGAITAAGTLVALDLAVQPDVAQGTRATVTFDPFVFNEGRPIPTIAGPGAVNVEGQPPAEPIFVAPGGTGDGTLENPFGSIQAALDATTQDGQAVVLAPGRYAEDAAVTVPRPLTFDVTGGAVTLTGDLTFEADPGVLGVGPVVVQGEIALGPAVTQVVDADGGEGDGPPIFGAALVTTGTAGLGNDAGWLAFGLPADATAAALADDIQLTALGQPLVYAYDPTQPGPTGTSFVPVTDPAFAVAAGATGLFHYRFDDAIEPVEPAQPLVIDLERPLDPSAEAGATFGGASTTVAVPVVAGDPAERFHLLAVPFLQSFDLESLTASGLPIGADGSGFQAGVQAWDAAAAEGAGSYVTLTAGDEQLEEDGETVTPLDVLAAQQGFFVERTTPGAGPEALAFEAAGRTTGAPFVGPATKAAAPVAHATVRLQATAQTAGGARLADLAATLVLSDAATDGWDGLDLTKLAPWPDAEGRWLALSVMGAGADAAPIRKAQESRPRTLAEGAAAYHEVDLDLRTGGLSAPVEVTLTAPERRGLPSGWSVLLIDRVAERSVRLPDPGDAYTFVHPPTADAAAAAAAPKSERAVRLPRALTLDEALAAPAEAARRTAAKAEEEEERPRFVLRVGPADGLPVELARFTAAVEGADVRLAWATVTETQNAGFVVEQRRVSSRGEAGAWQEVGFVEGAGTTATPQRYAFRVPRPGYGRHAFRLRQLDTDGTATPTDPVEVDVRLAARYDVAAFPNPFRDAARVAVTARRAQHAAVHVYDLLGRRVATLFDGPLRPSETRRLTWRAPGMASGVYLVRVEAEMFRATRRLTLVR